MQSRIPDFLKVQDPDLAGLIMDLRAEIAALREQLKPVPSLILTGQQVVSEFKQLTEVGRLMERTVA